MEERAGSRPDPVLPVVGLLACDAGAASGALAALASEVGPVRFESPAYRWVLSRYYEREMGESLLRKFLGFDRLMPPLALVSLKAKTREIEESWSLPLGGELRRRVNVDPGYIDSGKLVLASRKFAGHRLYLGEGVFAEVTLLFERGRFHALATTYRDYGEPRALRFFADVRGFYLGKLRQWRRAGRPPVHLAGCGG